MPHEMIKFESRRSSTHPDWSDQCDCLNNLVRTWVVQIAVDVYAEGQGDLLIVDASNPENDNSWTAFTELTRNNTH